MVAIEELYAAAARAGLLTPVIVNGVEVMVDFRAPDEDVLDGLAVSRSYSIRYPASALAGLAPGDAIQIASVAYRVREVSAVGDGTERRATLTRS